MNESTNRLGEVVEAASDRFAAQSYRLYEAPPLGALIRAGSTPSIYAVVASVATSSLDPTRRVIARGIDSPSETAIYHSNPQLEKLLHTYFQAVIVGYAEDSNSLHQYLPPLPPRIHAFVYTCTPIEICTFTEHLNFLNLLVKTDHPISDEVLAACLRRSAQAYEDPTAFLIRACRELASLLAGDIQRLTQVLRRVT